MKQPAQRLHFEVSKTPRQEENAVRCRRPISQGILAGIACTILAACGDSSSSTSPTPTPTPSPTSATITIANNAVSPQRVTITRGGTVTFVNNDSQMHEMASDPHPVHTDCPAINQVGVLAPGQSRQTGALNTARTCGFHDHQQATVSSLSGTITIQ
jgi:plastocyanin